MKILIMGAPTASALKCYTGNDFISGGGWVENLVSNLSMKKDLKLYVCFYYDHVEQIEEKYFNGVNYIALPIRVKGLKSCNNKMIEDLKKMYNRINPDVVHIIGTEREHNLRLLEIAGSRKTIISVTGLISLCAIHYYGGIEQKQFKIRSIGDFLRHGGPIIEKKLFKKYAKSESELIKKARYITGRTTWDYACIKQMNSKIEYTFCGEILNDIFYNNVWDLSKIDRYRIFVSQASYPLKGFHKLIDALPIILKFYPETEVYIAGPNILDRSTLKARIKQTTYGKYLIKQINKYNIPLHKLHFTGPLNAKGMLNQYLKANVFVLPSIIENSPNSLGEAMLLGVPCVSSCVGGIQDMISDKVDAFIYPYDEPYMMAHYICQIFSNDELSRLISEKARKKAKKRFDITQTIETTHELYNNILKRNSEK